MNEPGRYEYVLTGRNRRGRRVTEIVVAESADEAVRHFEAAGRTEITLHTDDNAARFLTPSKTLKTITPRQYVGYRARGRVGCMLFLIRRLYTQSWWAYGLFLGVLVLRRLDGDEWALVDSAAAAFLVFPILFGVYCELTSKALPYRRALRAVLRARWEDVPRHMRRVRIPMPPFERPFREAQALAGLGRLDEALDHFRPVADDPAVPSHMYWMYKGLIFQTARERERALDCQARAAELAPDNPVILIDYALGLLNVRGDTRKARERLAAARRHALSDVSTPLCEYAEGVLALKERRPADAVGLLESAARSLYPFTGGNPAVEIVVARIRAHLALAHAAAGDHEAARRAYRQAEPVLAPHDPPELARCREVLG
jgi:tetratricopeptide (TPR) repeat protein